MAFGAVLHSSWSDLSGKLANASQFGLIAPFQRGPWLAAWYATLGSQDGVRALPVEIFDAKTQDVVAVLPLILRRKNSLVVIEFADLGVTDYNAAIFFANNERRHFDPRLFFNAVRAVLPEADLLELSKMPKMLGDICNPLTELKGIKESSLNANFVRIGDSWEEYRRKILQKKFRKEMERSWRVFERDAEHARFEAITDIDTAGEVLEGIERLQQERMEQLGLAYELKHLPYKAFYKELINQGVGNGDVVLTALKFGENQLAAALLGIRHGEYYAMVRLAQDHEHWSHCSPGKLVIDQSMRWLHNRGVRSFDFTTGDYPYKKGFGVSQSPLYDLHVPLSLKGQISLSLAKTVSSAKDQLRNYPKVYDWIKKSVQ